jgi:hypothetical protein
LISFGGTWKFPKEATLPDIKEVGLAAAEAEQEQEQEAQAQLQRKEVLRPV